MSINSYYYYRDTMTELETETLFNPLSPPLFLPPSLPSSVVFFIVQTAVLGTIS